MAGFTKLFSEILDSTVWDESDGTRLVWITMLAMADRKGFVMSSIPGLAKRARQTIEATEAALEKLKSPDNYSRSKEHSGRRIIEVDGGWRLLNYVKYREKRNDDERRIYKAEWMRKARGHGVDNVDKCGPALTAVDRGGPIAEAEAEAEKKDYISAEPKASPIGIDADCRWVSISEKHKTIWREAYPAVDIDLELAKMTAWLRANPIKAKRSRYERFIVKWLSKTQDNGGSRGGGTQLSLTPKKPLTFTPPTHLKTIQPKEIKND